MPLFERPPSETLALAKHSQEDDLPLGILGRCGFGKSFQIRDAAPDGMVQLPRKLPKDTGEAE